MATDTKDPEAAARATLALLETRLRHLEFLLKGTTDQDGIPEPATSPAHGKDTVWSRLDHLEGEFERLKKHSGAASTMIRDIEHLSFVYPDLFASTLSASEVPPKSQDLSTLASIVLAHATLFPETASRLSSLQTLQIPPAEQSSELLSLVPRLEQCNRTEEELANEVQVLRERSARCLEWWIKVGVVGMGDLWEDWERRVGEVEKHLIRWERRAKEEQGYL
ncbi:uncharacterized protein PV06_02731 [Exophiala oligosperma]|uniref:Nuclear distribution protein RO10 n=1 Tax=Exophiala oligosperma TaxID=215243 RepID=A0A0D2DVK8_9EURO|nr:uncharacterized protein PV06_02731 [Exophiala oligosperma]KIW47133.1 hypothetical protein PV06_02731 [Exophiala oligosperma]